MTDTVYACREMCFFLHSFYFLRLRQSPVYATPRRNDTAGSGPAEESVELKVGRSVNFKRQTLPSLKDGRRSTSRIQRDILRTSCVFSYVSAYQIVYVLPHQIVLLDVDRETPRNKAHFNTADGLYVGTHGTVQLLFWSE